METGKIIDGKAAAARVRAEVASLISGRVAAGHRPPGLATVLVGEDPASQVYIRNKRKQASEAGLIDIHHHLTADTTQDALLSLVACLNAAEEVDGILVQLPLPRHIDERAVLQAIDPDKDVDGFHPVNVARLVLGLPGYIPCTPLGCMRLLADAGVELAGAHAVVVGRSNIVGKPLAQLLLQANATVTIAHSRTADLAQVCRSADILVAAVGRARLIGRDHVKPGAVVIDVGMNRDSDGRLCGDVDFAEVGPIARAITPVPGGVGPMTIAHLLVNTTLAHARHLGLPESALEQNR